jgi:hypothetical protein
VQHSERSASLTAATYQNGANLGLAMFALGAALAVLTLLFTVIAIFGPAAQIGSQGVNVTALIPAHNEAEWIE